MIFSKGVALQTLTSGAASLEIIGAAQVRAHLLSLEFILEAAPGGTVTMGLGQPAAPGQGPTLLTSTNEDGGALADLFPLLATAWVTAPTLPTNFLRRYSLDNVQGQGFIWQFPRGLVTPQASSWVLWNLTALGNASVYLTWDA